MRNLTLAALPVTTLGCLTAAGRNVIVTEDREAVRGCTQLKRLHEAAGNYMWGDMAPSRAEKENEIEMQNETAKAGGNVLLLLTGTRGVAFKCLEAQAREITLGGKASDVSPTAAAAPLPTLTPIP